MNTLDTLIMYSFLILSVGLTFLANYYVKRIQRLVKNRPDASKRYGQNVVAGIVSGVIVLLVDRIITPLYQINFRFIGNTVWDTVLSAAIILLVFYFSMVLLLVLILYIIHKGMGPE